MSERCGECGRKMPKVADRRAGGLARAAALSPERRTEIARAAANKRWQK